MILKQHAILEYRWSLTWVVFNMFRQILVWNFPCVCQISDISIVEFGINTDIRNVYHVDRPPTLLPYSGKKTCLLK